MERRKAEPLLSPIAVVMMLAVLAGMQRDLRRNGVGGDVQEVVPDFVKNMRRQYDRKQRAQALRLRRHWRKADVVKLWSLPTPDEWRKLHRKMPTYPRLIEAAYRGELARAKQQMPRSRDAAAGRDDFPHRKASEIAEEEVAEAAGISVWMVHALCQHARDDSKRWAAARRGRGLVEETMTADQLRQHLAELAELREPQDLR